MSFFTNPFAPNSPVPVFASSPLNPLPSASFPLPANLRRASASHIRATPSPSPQQHYETSAHASGSGSGGGGSGMGTHGGISFVSPFGGGPPTGAGSSSPGGSPSSRRNSAAPTTPARGSSHSRLGGPEYASSASPGSRRGSVPTNATPLRAPATTSPSPSSSPVPPTTALPFFANLAATQPPPVLFKPHVPVDFSRRRSVDVGVLGLGTHRQNGVGSMSRRVRDAVGPDAGDKETGFVPSSGLKSGKDRLLGRHLAGILAHSLSLCADAPPPTTDILPSPIPVAESVLPLGLAEALAAIPGSPATSPSTSRHTSVSESTFSTAPSLSDTAPTYDSQLPLPPQAPVFPVLSEAKRFKLIGNLQSWTFNAMSYNPDELLSCVGIMFESVRNMDGVQFDADRFKALLLSLRSAYHARNGYHNFSHATDVTQACYSFLVRMGLAPPLYLLCEDDYDTNLGEGRRKWRRNRAVEEGGMGELLRPMDVFALMVAAIGHDVGHPGLSNAYMVNARTPVAQVYDDKSVLENFHTVTLIHMLRRHQFDYLLGGDFGHLGDQATSFRKVVEASILATDMSRHFGFVNQLNDLGRRFGERRGGGSNNVEEDRLLLCSGLIKCADISNPTRPHRISRAWSTALLDEWTVQAAIETEFGLPISVMQLDPADTKAQAKSQVGFIDLFAKPLFNAMAGVVDEFADFAEKLRDGRIAWEAISLQTDEAFSRPSLSTRSSAAPSPILTAPLVRTASAAGSTHSNSTPDASATSGDSGGTLSVPSLPLPVPIVPTLSAPPSSSRGRAFRPQVLALHRHHSGVSSAHGRQHSDGSTSSTQASPISPCFPGSVSTGATSISTTDGEDRPPSGPSGGGGVFSRSPRANGAFFTLDDKLSCGGACQAVTSTCETCSRRQDPGARRDSLGRALAGILATAEDPDETAGFKDDYLEDEPDTWPSWCFR
ncbi:hypothetical protein RQP46_001350 [Phenoliferia psychrophenolica]